MSFPSVWELDLSQMSSAPRKRARTGSYARSRTSFAVARQRQIRVPRAISTRGTEKGYYEFPTTQLIRIYCNTSTGFWVTNQTNCNPVGATGYSGMAMYFRPDNTIINLGNGTISANFSVNPVDFPNFRDIFDEVKIAKISCEAWVTAQSSSWNHTPNNATEIWMTPDPNDANPPTTSIQEHSRIKRILPDRAIKLNFTPHVTNDVNADAGAGTTTSVGGSSSSYVSASGIAAYYGIKFFNWIPLEPDTAQVYFLNLRITQTRRYKNLR